MLGWFGFPTSPDLLYFHYLILVIISMYLSGFGKLVSLSILGPNRQTAAKFK